MEVTFKFLSLELQIIERERETEMEREKEKKGSHETSGGTILSEELPVMWAKYWTVEVLPVPVSPTNRTGSPLLTHTASCSIRTEEGRVAAKVSFSLEQEKKSLKSQSGHRIQLSGRATTYHVPSSNPGNKPKPKEPIYKFFLEFKLANFKSSTNKNEITAQRNFFILHNLVTHELQNQLCHWRLLYQVRC